jgi:hypothetical protein
MYASRSGEAGSQRRQSWLPWIWLLMGLVVVAMFVGWLLIGGALASRGVPRQSASFSAITHHPR